MIKFSDVYVTTVARGLCGPNEQFVSAGAGSRQSFWTFGIPWFRHAYLLIATNERLMVIDHRKGLVFDRMDRVDSYRWADLGEVKVKGVFTKKLVAKDAANRTVLEMKLPKAFVTPIANNATGINAVVQTWQQRRTLPPAAPDGQLPAQAFTAPFAQPQPQYRAPIGPS
jgi:hypothetical protein